MLKMIPQENPSRRSAKNGAKKWRDMSKLQFKGQIEQNAANRELRGFYAQIFHYIKKVETFGIREMNELIDNARHFIFNLEHRRIKLIRKKNKKNRRG